MIDILLFVFFLAVSLFVLIRGADLFLFAARSIGASVGMSKFSIGVLIVGFGTSIPELASSLSAAFRGDTAIIAANAVGSNITNILLIMGVLAAFSGRIIIKRDLIKAELPVFFISVAIFFVSVIDGYIDRLEAGLLLGTFIVYLWYLFVEAPKEDSVKLLEKAHHKKSHFKYAFYALLGIVGIFFGAQYSVEMVVNIAEVFDVPLGLVSITAIAMSTSLPELFVSLRAIKEKEAGIAVGNLFGSNVFNMLVVVGLPGLIAPIVADETVMIVGIPFLLAASAIIFVHGLARQILRWEGMMMLLFYFVFLVKLYALV